MKVLICGSRTFDRPELVETFLFGTQWMLPETEKLVVIEGGCPHGGADAHAESWARRQNHVELVHMPADWDRHGRSAGPIRNQQMLDNNRPVDLVVAFVDKPLAESRGTADMVRRARKAGVRTVVVAV